MSKATAPFCQRPVTPPPHPPQAALSKTTVVDVGGTNIDPVDEFLAVAKKPLSAKGAANYLAAELHATVDAMVVAPLFFDNGQQKENVGLMGQLDVFRPILSGPDSSPD